LKFKDRKVFSAVIILVVIIMHTKLVIEIGVTVSESQLKLVLDGKKVERK
jgi:hypothetical protein